MIDPNTEPKASWQCSVRIPSGKAMLDGEVQVPENASGIVLFAHGSGSSRYSPRNRYVARTLYDAGLGILLFDLLTPEEEAIDLRTHQLRFDLQLLAVRLMYATAWVASTDETQHLRIGYFGASTGGGAALVAASRLGHAISAVVSRGGRPDLAGATLPDVVSPTLLIVGGRDEAVLQLNEEAYTQLKCEKELRVVPNATHLFEEPSALEAVAQLATGWFQQHLSLEDTLEQRQPPL